MSEKIDGRKLRKVKCPTCGTMNSKEDTRTIGGRYYCIACAEEKEKKTKANKDGWDELFECICRLYSINTLTGMMFIQIKRFRDEFGYTNTGMQLTLEYYYDTLGNEVKDDTGLGIIPYYYDRAKNHYIDRLNVVKYMQGFEDTEKIDVVQINSNNTKDNKLLEKKNKNLLSFDNIKWEDEA